MSATRTAGGSTETIAGGSTGTIAGDSTGTAPAWLLQSELAMCPCGCIGKRKKGSFVEKTLTGAADLLRQVMFSEDVALQ
ncbi:MAG TPA: hypothetical protein VHN80_04275, partial [Kineosporiaceae bacterium]|nr:hypothetical protein [Kineosporiaceae bacterium]